MPVFINTGADRATCEYLQKSMKDPEYKKVTVTFEGHTKTISMLLQMLAYMERLGAVGHSTSFTVGFDGDGFARFKTKEASTNKPLMKMKELEPETGYEQDIKSFGFE
ncbi:MAG: hypothetical protein NC548_20065 [Lachnospiraceae bacterium]|nr:hypothetical protein [Lachnospiraceae bacterium]